LSLNFKRVFDGHADSNKRVWEHDRSKTVGASEQFQCIRRTFFVKRGYKPDPDFKESYGATTRGSLLEAHYVVPALRSQLPDDAHILWAGDDQVTLIKDRLSATPDGLITGLPRDALKDYGIDDIEGDEILVEIKTFDSRLDLKEPKPVHAGQVQQQMGLVWETTNHRPNYAVILYINASWLDDVRPFVIKRDPAIYEACKKRADLVYEATEAKALAAEGKLRGGAECDYCPFQQQCSLAQVGRIPEETPGTKKRRSDLALNDEQTLTTLVVRERDASAREKAAKTDKAAAQEAIKTFLIGIGKRWANLSDGSSVSWTKMAGRKSVDMDRVVEDTGIDLADYMVEGSPSERLTVRSPKDE
jgi:CRISPR/Cas system-associated exonuclease Cas4 (RecB family)